MRAAQKGLKMSCIRPFGHGQLFFAQGYHFLAHGQHFLAHGQHFFAHGRLGSSLETHGFDTFFEPFVVPNWPIFKALLALRGAKIAQHGLKMGSFHLFVHPK